MRYVSVILLFSAMAGFASAADVFNMGGTRNPTTGAWTGLASVEFVNVGDAGNSSDATKYGAVNYAYRMGKYDVTIGQYCEFLNAVAKTDTYGLYSSGMASDFPTIHIIQNGSSGNYSYSITGSCPTAANCPIFDVEWVDAARFCNWLHNGQPVGLQGANTTETGAYSLNGKLTDTDAMNVRRNSNAKYFIPSENEWYKAAYYKGGGKNAGYWDYPTRSNTIPSNQLSAAGTNNMNYDIVTVNPTLVQIFSDPTNFLTPVGAFAATPGPYGTYDMGGNVWQYNESVVPNGADSSPWRGIRGGSWDDDHWSMESTSRAVWFPYTLCAVGFRVACIPEPSTLALLLTAAFGGLLWRRRNR